MDLSKLSDEELKQLHKTTKNSVTKYHNFQLTKKIILNSGYGAMSNRWFAHYSDDMAESITLSGQLSLKWIDKKLNLYFNKLLKTDNIDYVIYGDTDSVTGDSIIYVNGNKVSISDFYDSIENNFIKKDDFNENYVKSVQNAVGLGYDKNDICYKPIKYVMKHKVKKRMFKIIHENSEVIVTEDHSIIVRNKKTKKISSIKPQKLDPEKYEIINISYTDTECEVINEKTDDSRKI